MKPAKKEPYRMKIGWFETGLKYFGMDDPITKRIISRINRGEVILVPNDDTGTAAAVTIPQIKA